VEEIVHQPKSDALRAMFWRSEILQVMYWLRGESLGLGSATDEADACLLERFLGVDADVGVKYLDRLVDEGYLEAVTEPGPDRRYRLSEEGLSEGRLEWASSFAELTRPTHGECSADCWCHNSPDEAAACQAERSEHSHNDN